MGDLLPVFVLAIVGIMAGALFDCVTTDERLIRHFPRNLWIAVILLLPGVGGLMWFTFGRLPAAALGSHITSGHPAGRGRVESAPSMDIAPPRTLAPDDDPAFLAQLAEMNRAARSSSDSGLGLAGTGGRGGSDAYRDEERLRRWEADLRQREERLRQRGEPPIED
jgi:Phospholipase_D-nuclease N-terminal